jgi:preprotein translocase subunit SecG
MGTVLFHWVVPIIHVLSCLFLIVVVLLQTGKGADMGAVFGGGSQTLFGSSGAGNFLTHLTTATAIIFMLTSLILTYGQTPGSSRLLERLPPPAAQVPAPSEVPAAEGGTPAPQPPVAEAPEATPPAAQAPAPTPPAGTAAPAEGNAPAAGGTAPAPTPAPATK